MDASSPSNKKQKVHQLPAIKHTETKKSKSKRKQSARQAIDGAGSLPLTITDQAEVTRP